MLYKAPNGGVVPRPKRIGNTFIGTQTDLTQFGYLPVTPDKPTDAPDGQRYVATNGSEVGGEWQVTWVLEAIPPKPAPDNGTRITKLAMRNRFTADEKRAIYGAADTNVDIKIYLDDLNAATFIDLSRQDTIANVNMLEQGGLIGTGRADEIINSPVQTNEVYNKE